MQFIYDYGANAKISWVQSGLGANEKNAIIQKTLQFMQDTYQSNQDNFCAVGQNIINTTMTEN